MIGTFMLIAVLLRKYTQFREPALQSPLHDTVGAKVCLGYGIIGALLGLAFALDAEI